MILIRAWTAVAWVWLTTAGAAGVAALEAAELGWWIVFVGMVGTILAAFWGTFSARRLVRNLKRGGWR